MKALLTLSACLLAQTGVAQFALIAAKDGFVNVRTVADVTSPVIDKLTNGQVVYCLEGENRWLPVDYGFTRQNGSGYIHASGLQFISRFAAVPYSKLTDSSITFRTSSLRLTLTKTPFNPKHNRLQYRPGNPAKNIAASLERINGKEIWGTDGDLSKTQYGQIVLQVGKDKIYLPKDNLFEPSLELTSVTIDPKNTIYISATNGDAAGAYVVLWIVEKGKLKRRITTIPF